MALFHIEPLKKTHKRMTFSCGVPELDRYLQKLASQDIKRKVSTVFVAVAEDDPDILGFYTLPMASLSLADVPATLAKKLPLYPAVPAVRLGRLAVSESAQGKGLGQYLLMDAMQRAVTNEIAWAVFLVDAKDDNARRFYQQFGFLSLQDNLNHLFLPRQTIEKAFGRS